jgi:hypothetical protein
VGSSAPSPDLHADQSTEVNSDVDSDVDSDLQQAMRESLQQTTSRTEPKNDFDLDLDRAIALSLSEHETTPAWREPLVGSGHMRGSSVGVSSVGVSSVGVGGVGVSGAGQSDSSGGVDGDCPICLERLRGRGRLVHCSKCIQGFHAVCREPWGRRPCPVCRRR